MSWLKDVFLDVVVLILVVIYGITSNQVLEIILWIYTALLLLSKILVFFMPSLSKRANKTSAPAYIYHIVYLLIILIFIYAINYYLATAWIVIWVTSFLQNRSAEKSDR